MKKKWATQTKDMLIAQLIMEEYAQKKQLDELGLFELVVNTQEKRMNFRLANWVIALVERFNAMYGADQGHFVARQILSSCMIEGKILH